MPLGCRCFSSLLCCAVSAPCRASCLPWLSSCQCCSLAGQQFLSWQQQRGVPATAALLSPSTPWACSSWLQLHQEGLDIPTARPHSAHMFQIPAGGRAEYTETVLSLRPPGLLRRDLLDQVPSTTFKQLQTPQLGLELTLSSDFHISCGLDGLVLGYFGQLNHYLCTARLL